MPVNSDAVTSRTVTLSKSYLFPFLSFFKICPREQVHLVLKYEFLKNQLRTKSHSLFTSRQMKLVSDQESKHWFVCRAQPTSKVFVTNKFRLVIYQLWNCAGWQQWKHQCLHPVFTGVFCDSRTTSGSQAQKIRTKAQEIQATDFKYD